jgi:beta-N-acetylhexosaminidase
MSPLIVGIAGVVLNDEELELLCDLRVHGVILFTRNFKDRLQLQNLCRELHKLKTPALKIYVDQEGGRVQRFRDGFSILPALGQLGELYQASKKKALVQAKEAGYIMVHELKEVGIDQSFAPVLDLDNGSQVIGDRAFSFDPGIVVTLAHAYLEGMQDAGMSAILKHFPGHGTVKLDTHVDFAIDERHLQQLEKMDLLPFQELLSHPNVMGVMMAHVVYKNIDPFPASLSRYWIDNFLRQRWHFKGKIFSDDLGMKAVSNLATPQEVVKSALHAGCDYVLLCNDWPAVVTLLKS